MSDDVTPEMVEAGIKAWDRWQRSSDYSVNQLVAEIYRAMRDADLSKSEEK